MKCQYEMVVCLTEGCDTITGDVYASVHGECLSTLLNCWPWIIFSRSTTEAGSTAERNELISDNWRAPFKPTDLILIDIYLS